LTWVEVDIDVRAGKQLRFQLWRNVPAVPVKRICANPVAPSQGAHSHTTRQRKVDRGMLAMTAGGTLCSSSCGHGAAKVHCSCLADTERTCFVWTGEKVSFIGLSDPSIT